MATSLSVRRCWEAIFFRGKSIAVITSNLQSRVIMEMRRFSSLERYMLMVVSRGPIVVFVLMVNVVQVLVRVGRGRLTGERGILPRALGKKGKQIPMPETRGINTKEPESAFSPPSPLSESLLLLPLQ